jgi:tRNA G37 N-methylase TrmD
MSIIERLVRGSDETISSWREVESENRESCVRKDLTRRLKCVCDDLSSVEFDALVVQMTREQLRGERVMGRVLR